MSRRSWLNVACTVSYETVRACCAKFGPSYAAGLRRRRAQASDKWHLDGVQLKIKGKRHWLWRALDNQGVVLDILVQQRRDQLAAVTFLRRVLAAALRRALPTTEHRRHKWLNDRAENSHQPTRQRERAMRRFKSPEQEQRFLGPFRAAGAHFESGVIATRPPPDDSSLAEQRSTWAGRGRLANGGLIETVY